MVKIDFTGAGQYWLSCPETTDSNLGGALWIDLGECGTEADVLAAVYEYEVNVLDALNAYTEAVASAIDHAAGRR